MRAYARLGLITFCAVLGGYGIAYGQLADSPWPMRGHDASHTGQSPYLGAQLSVLVWTYQTGGRVSSSPAIGADGTVVVGSWDGKVYAFGDPATAVEETEEIMIPRMYALSQNYPNPFNPRTTIPYALPQASVVRLRIYDIRGVRVRMLVNGLQQKEGYHQVVWDGRDERGREVGSGIYLCRLEVLRRFGEVRVVRTRKMALIR